MNIVFSIARLKKEVKGISSVVCHSCSDTSSMAYNGSSVLCHSCSNTSKYGIQWLYC